jgi:hypothetical protein
MCAPSPPPAPDYIGAAQTQGAQNIKAAQTQAKLNNPNVITPYGNQTVEWGTGFDQSGYDKALQNYTSQKAAFDKAYNQWATGGGGGNGGGGGILDAVKQVHDPTSIFGLFGGGDRGPFEGPFEAFWPSGKPPVAPVKDNYILNPNQATIRQTLSPEQQAIFDQTNRVKKLLGGLGEQGATSLQGVVGKGIDYSGIPAMPGNAEDTRNKVINAMMSRVNEDTNVSRDNANSELIAAGIRPGSTAYDNRMRSIDRAYNDARNVAFMSAGQEASRDFGLDAERRRQAITEMLAQREVPINEITALVSGSQVQNPFAVPGFQGGNQIAPAPTFAGMNALSGYNTDLFNARSAAASNQQGAAAGLGSAALMAGAMMF